MFKEFWKKINMGQSIQKSERLSRDELVKVQQTIATLQRRGIPSSKIINKLQQEHEKLREHWKAERAYWTEVKRDDTKLVGRASDDLEIDKFRVILSPHACPICIKKTDNGGKIFKSNDITKSGYGHVPPFHPNCYCIIIPVA
jgi:hypothetical protein